MWFSTVSFTHITQGSFTDTRSISWLLMPGLLAANIGTMPSHYPNPCWFITVGNKFLRNFNKITRIFSTWCNWECRQQNDGHFCLGLSLLCDIIIQSIPRDKRMEFQWFDIFTHVCNKIVEHDPCSCYRVDCRMNGMTYFLFSLWTGWQMLVTVWLMPAWPWQISSVQTDGLLHCLTHVKGKKEFALKTRQEVDELWLVGK